MTAAVLLTLALAASPTPADTNVVRGTGSHGMAELVNAWGAAWAKAGGGRVEYAPNSSAEGISNAMAAQVDFAMSERVLSGGDLAASGLTQFPVALDAVAPIVNLPLPAGTLRLSGPVLADMLAAKIPNWNAPVIAADNPGVTLPDLPVRVIRRGGGSGSTAVLIAYLAISSPAWRSVLTAGSSKMPGDAREVKDADEMMKAVEGTPGAIGYIDYSRLRDSKVSTVKLQNRDGNWVAPSPAAFRAAAAAYPWDKSVGYTVMLVNQKGPESWPITAPCFALVKTKLDPRAAQAMRFFDWALTSGAAQAEEAHMLPLRPVAVKAVQDWLARTLKTADGQPGGYKPTPVPATP